MLTVFANIRINSPERLQHMKDSFDSFSSTSDDWLVNVRGELREEALSFLRERLGEKMREFSLLDDKRGWINNALEMLPFVKNEYLLIWNEDHINIAPQEELRKVVAEMGKVDADYLLYSWWQEGRAREAFGVLPLKSGRYIDSILLTKERWQKVLDAEYKYALLSLVGIYRKDLFKDILLRDRYKLPLFFTHQVYRFFTLLQRLGLKFNQRQWFHSLNRLINFRLRSFTKEAPFDLEKMQDRFDMLPLKIALPKKELFACIDDNLREAGTSLIERGLYPAGSSANK